MMASIDTQVDDACAALLAVLRVIGRSPRYANEVRAWADAVLKRAGHEVTPLAWGEAVRHLRGCKVLVESRRGPVTWRLGSDIPEVSTEGWPDEGARKVVR